MPVAVRFRNVVTRLAADEAGLSTMEYGMILALVALGSIPALSALGGSSKQNLEQTEARVEQYRRNNADPFSRGNGSVARDNLSTGGNGGGANPSVNTGSSGGSGNQNARDPFEPAPMQAAPVS